MGSSIKGFSLIEVLVAISLLMVVAIGSLSVNGVATNSVNINKLRNQANTLVREGVEALYSVRANNFSSLRTGDFHPAIVSGTWTLAPGSETIGPYTRVITLSSVMRGLVCTTPVCDIVTGGGVTDPLTFKATVKVSWVENFLPKEYQINTLVTFWR